MNFIKIAVLILFCSTLAFSLSIKDLDKLDKMDSLDYASKAKEKANSEQFSQSYDLLKKASSHGLDSSEYENIEKYIKEKEKSYEARLERERLEKQRQEREEQARLQREREEELAQQQYNSSGFRGISENQCYRISEYAPREVCLKGTGGNACYALKDYALQQVCLKGAGSDACYAFKDYNKQQVCLKGINSDACYGFSDYSKSNSCSKFSGSTEFWLIFSSYGYYTF